MPCEMQQHPTFITVFCRLIFVGKHPIAKALAFKDKYSATSFLCFFLLRKKRSFMSALRNQIPTNKERKDMSGGLFEGRLNTWQKHCLLNPFNQTYMTIKLQEKHKIQVLNADDVYSIMQQILLRERKIDRNKEHFWIVCLTHSNTISLIELISLGSATATIIEPTEVFGFALQKQAAKLIMVHNHPSGTLQPSTNDISITERMMAIGKFLNLPVIDHLIISEKDYFSFANTLLLQKIAQETLYDLTFSEVDKLQAKLKIAKTKEEKLKNDLKNIEVKSKTEIAKNLKKAGITPKIIAETTGLTIDEIEKIN